MVAQAKCDISTTTSPMRRRERGIALRLDGPRVSAPTIDCVEKHLDELFAICRRYDGPTMDSYVKRLREELYCDSAICDEEECSRGLANLLPLAASALEAIDAKRRALADRLAWPFDEMPESD